MNIHESIRLSLSRGRPTAVAAKIASRVATVGKNMESPYRLLEGLAFTAVNVHKAEP